MTDTFDPYHGIDLRALLDSLPIAVFVKDVDSRIVLMNRACEEQWGLRLEDVIGTDASRYFPAEQIAKFKHDDRQVLCGGERVDTVEAIWNARLQQNRRGRTLKRALYDAHQQPLFLVAATLDISEATQARAEATALDERLRALYQLTRVGIALTDMEGRFLDFNQAFIDLTGYSADELLKLDYWALTPRDYAEQEAAQLEALRRTGHYGPYEKVYVRKNGDTVPLLLNGVMVHSPEGSPQIWSIVEDISEHKRTEATLRDAAQFKQAIFKAVPADIVVLDQHARVVRHNRDCPDKSATTPADLTPVLIDDSSLVTGLVQPTAAQLCEAAHAVCEGRRAGFNSDCHYRIDGQSLWYQLSITPLSEGAQGAVIVRSDITERVHNEQHARILAQVFTTAREGILLLDRDLHTIEANEAFTRMLGIAREELLGRIPSVLHSQYLADGALAQWLDNLCISGFVKNEFWDRTREGDDVCLQCSFSCIKDAYGAMQYVVAAFTDITMLKQHQSQLERVAFFDALTGLPNRVLFTDRLMQAMLHADRTRERLAVIYFDLDRFKFINDSWGRETGDALLIDLARDLQTCLHHGDSLARIGGDEFVAVLSDIDRDHDLDPILRKVLSSIERVRTVNGHQLTVSTSIGVTYYPQAEAVDADQLVRQADQAMYQAKMLGKNRYHLFDVELDRNLRGHHESQTDLRNALERREFILYYQPKVNLRTGDVIGAEALIRWNHPVRGILPPGAFLPLLDERTLEIAVGEWVIDEALTQMARWQALGLTLPVSVNVSPRQLLAPDFHQRLSLILARHPQVPPGQLELEILETSDLEDMSRASAVIIGCRDLGVHFALDDFGTGYSSLTYLKHLPVGLIKIDQSFVRDILRDPDDLAILDGILGMAQAFRRDVIAEGMETEEHGKMLVQFGCELAQGYGIARPMPPDKMPDWIKEWRPHPAWAQLQAAQRPDLPLLYGSVDLRVWITALEQYVNAPPHASQPAQRNQEVLEQWLTRDGQRRHGRHPAFAAVVHLYGGLRVNAEALANAKESNAHQDCMVIVQSMKETLVRLLDQIGLLLSTSASGEATH